VKRTLDIEEQTLRLAENEAARRGITVSAFVEAALQCYAAADRSVESDAGTIPTHRLGQPKVDVADRQALHRAMDAE